MIFAVLSVNGMNYYWDVNNNGSDFSYTYQAEKQTDQ